MSKRIQGKRINAAKLMATGFANVEKVCVKHAELAIQHMENGNRRKMGLHCNLLDQCAVVARKLKHARSASR